MTSWILAVLQTRPHFPQQVLSGTEILLCILCNFRSHPAQAAAAGCALFWVSHPAPERCFRMRPLAVFTLPGNAIKHSTSSHQQSIPPAFPLPEEVLTEPGSWISVFSLLLQSPQFILLFQETTNPRYGFNLTENNHPGAGAHPNHILQKFT